MSSQERDNSYKAIKERYDRANMDSIVTMNTLAFNSIRDVFYLLNKCKGLEERIDELQSQIITLTSSNK